MKKVVLIFTILLVCCLQTNIHADTTSNPICITADNDIENLSFEEMNNVMKTITNRPSKNDFFNKEKIIWDIQLRTGLKVEGGFIKYNNLAWDCFEVNLSGGGTNPCDPGAYYMYCQSTGRYYCCVQIGCYEAPAPY